MKILELSEQTAQQKKTPLQKRAWEFLSEKGLPTRQNEDWKYTSLKSLLEKNDFSLVPGESSLHRDQLSKLLGTDFINLVFVNGIFTPTLSQTLPDGITLGERSEDDQQQDSFADGLDALHVLHRQKSYLIKVEKEESFSQVIHLLFWSEGSFSSPSVRIEVGARSRVQFIETHSGSSENSAFCNPRTQIQVGDSAKLSFVRLQDEARSSLHVGKTKIALSSHAQLENFCFSTGAKLGRHTLELSLDGPGTSSQVNGIYVVTGDQHVDNNTLIDHKFPAGQSEQLYKGLLDGKSRAVFTGKVYIQRDAQKVNSSQLNNNLLLSRQAEVDSKPLLQIDADDVKATHGSTVGQMNQEELFYLLSRAIPRKKAIPLLSYGFLSEVILKLENEKTQSWLTKRLDQAFRSLNTEQL